MNEGLLRVKNCTIVDSQLCGAMVEDGGRLSLQDCTLSGGVYGLMFVNAGSRIELAGKTTVSDYEERFGFDDGGTLKTNKMVVGRDAAFHDGPLPKTD